jgi:hypothetical protein
MKTQVLNTIAQFLIKCQEERRQKMITMGYLQAEETYSEEKWLDFREKWFRGELD